MRVPTAYADRETTSLSMTPMIDVVFLLLIFFVCTADFQPPELVLPSQLPLPRRGNTELPPQLDPVDLEQLIVTVGGDAGRLHLQINGQPCASRVELRELLQALAAIDGELPVVLDVAARVPLGTAIDVFDDARLAGFRQVQFATESAEPAR
jgi:biopolymer transport protein ExbD